MFWVLGAARFRFLFRFFFLRTHTACCKYDMRPLCLIYLSTSTKLMACTYVRILLVYGSRCLRTWSECRYRTGPTHVSHPTPGFFLRPSLEVRAPYKQWSVRGRTKIQNPKTHDQRQDVMLRKAVLIRARYQVRPGTYIVVGCAGCGFPARARLQHISFFVREEASRNQSWSAACREKTLHNFTRHHSCEYECTIIVVQ